MIKNKKEKKTRVEFPGSRRVSSSSSRAGPRIPPALRPALVPRGAQGRAAMPAPRTAAAG